MWNANPLGVAIVRLLSDFENGLTGLWTTEASLSNRLTQKYDTCLFTALSLSPCVFHKSVWTNPSVCCLSVFGKGFLVVCVLIKEAVELHLVYDPCIIACIKERRHASDDLWGLSSTLYLLILDWLVWKKVGHAIWIFWKLSPGTLQSLDRCWLDCLCFVKSESELVRFRWWHIDFSFGDRWSRFCAPLFDDTREMHLNRPLV